MEKDYYKILGVDKNASEQDIRKAFLKLSKKYHPDMQSGKSDDEKKEAEEKFKEINEANEILSNKEKREYYDNFGTINQEYGFGAGGIDPREFFRKFTQSGFGMGGFGWDNDFGDFNRQNHTPPDPTSPKNGKTIQIQINIDIEDVFYGSNKDIEITVHDPCPHCFGTGSENGELIKCEKCNGTGMITNVRGNMIINSTCHHCHGSGFKQKNKCPYCNNGKISNIRKLNINIPQGIDEGCILRIRNEGERGLNGGQNGDIRIIVSTNKHELFERKNLDLLMNLYISPTTSILGGDVDVQTPWGLAKLSIPKYTSNNTLFRLTGQGIRHQNEIGDLYIRCKIDSIKNCTKEQEILLHNLEKTLTEENLENKTKQKNIFKQFYKNNKEKITKKNV
jgi:molecular chaperone DnaJ